MKDTIERRKQKKKSRDKNNITTMQLSRFLKSRLVLIQEFNQFDKQDEALDEVINFYVENHPDVLKSNIESEDNS